MLFSTFYGTAQSTGNELHSFTPPPPITLFVSLIFFFKCIITFMNFHENVYKLLVTKQIQILK